MTVMKYFPSNARKPTYAVFAIIGIVIGAFHVGFGSVNVVDPDWLTISQAVYPFLAAAVGFTAVVHTPKDEDTADAESFPVEVYDGDEDLDDDV